MADNLIRTKQINQTDLSGVVQDVIDSNAYQITYGGTGINVNNVGQITVSGTDVYLIDSIFNVSGTGIFTALDLNNVDTLNLSGIVVNINGADVNLGNNLNVSGDLTVGGTIKYSEIIDITTTGNISGYTGYFQALYANNLVYNTGDQTISGIKTFAQTGSFNTLQITNKKLSSYFYNTTNFFFGDNYLNFVNSSNNVTGTLPSGIISGINYYVKNLNSGILLITGSGQRTIDGFSTVNLYKNESVQLIGVNSVGYTGWVTISADGGIS